MGWDALNQWGNTVRRIERLTGGTSNDVWSIDIDGRLAVARLGTRSDADLAWETGLLQHLDRHGMIVPLPIPARNGRLFVQGLVVMEYMVGGPPQTAADWRRVAQALRQLHAVTQDWPQRPGWAHRSILLKPIPARGSILAPCLQKRWPAAAPPGRAFADATGLWFMAIPPTPPISA